MLCSYHSWITLIAHQSFWFLKFLSFIFLSDTEQLLCQINKSLLKFMLLKKALQIHKMKIQVFIIFLHKKTFYNNFCWSFKGFPTTAEELGSIRTRSSEFSMKGISYKHTQFWFSQHPNTKSRTIGMFKNPRSTRIGCNAPNVR